MTPKLVLTQLDMIVLMMDFHPKVPPGHDVLVPQSRGLDGSDAQGPFWVGHHDSDQYTASGNERQMI